MHYTILIAMNILDGDLDRTVIVPSQKSLCSQRIAYELALRVPHQEVAILSDTIRVAVSSNGLVQLCEHFISA